MIKTRKLNKTPGACAIIALRYAADTTAEEALKACLAQGLFDEQWRRAAEELKLKIERVVYKPIMLRKFIRKYPTGLYIMGTHNHLFVVDNGRVVDPGWGKPGLSRMIREAWKVIESG